MIKTKLRLGSYLLTLLKAQCVAHGKTSVNVSKKIDGSSPLSEGPRGVGVVGVTDLGEGFVSLGGALPSDRWEHFLDRSSSESFVAITCHVSFVFFSLDSP